MAESAIPGGTALDSVGDCWRRIGVAGDRSCPLLADHIHCRNCPTYSRAAIALLDKLPAGGEYETGSATVSATVSGTGQQHHAGGLQEGGHGHGGKGNDGIEGVDGSSGTKLSCLVFRVRSEWLALPSLALAEVSPPCPVHSLPHRRHPAIAGLAAVRGSLLVCVSLARLLDPQAPAADPTARGARMLILGQGRAAIALPVDEVAGVERIDASALQPLPTTVPRASLHFTQALLSSGGRNIGLLDPGLLQQAIKRSLA